MARQRITASELARMLNAAEQPIYVLDDELTIVFLNRACQEWLGAGAEELVGRQCMYHSGPAATRPDALAAGLCPPPDVLTGRSLTAGVAVARDSGATVYRQARFVPLGSSAEDLAGIIALVETEDLAKPPPIPPESVVEPETDVLHEQVRRFRRELAGRFRADRLIGNSPAICRARRQVELAAGNRCSVLVVGPRGSGRQHVAHAIHYGAGPDSAGSLVPLDCAVLSADLIQSTVRALAAGRPRDEDAGRSTLLLNQADQLPFEVQAALASLLVGRPFPLRLIATAEQGLGELVRHGRFHEELAAMLSTVTIELPPLCARRGDIPLLSQVLLEEINAQGDKQVGHFSAEALDRLDAYLWPGNADELAQVVAEAHQRTGGVEITVGDLPERLHLAAKAAAHPRRAEETIVLDEFLGRVERELVRRALARAKGNKAKAARLLGLTRPRLYRRMVQLGLE